jgi:NitT/TauT family transport system permease protein
MSTVAVRSLPARPDYERRPEKVGQIGEIKRSLKPLERWMRRPGFRKLLLLALMAALWQTYATALGNELLLPTFTSTMQAFVAAALDGTLIERTFFSLRTLLAGYAVGVLLAGILVGLSATTRTGSDFLSLVTAMFNPLPAIALLPLAMLWFGLGTASIVFVIVHSVLWAVALNTHSGFQGVPETTRMAGQSFGLRGIRYILGILVPAAFPSILSGLKIGWAFAWRTLIAAELVFGATANSGGLGWFIYENRNALETPSVFAGLLTVIGLGLFVEEVIFRTIERRSIRRWGMQQ